MMFFWRKKPNPESEPVQGSMNIDFSESYDPEEDIYYVTFKTGEPSIVAEMEDNLLVEVGMFTGMPTGFRILNFKKADIPGLLIEKAVNAADALFESAKSRFESDSDIRETQFEESLKKVLA
ncbi:MAG TPA: hypothetical protein VNX27_00975 [Chthoniobacterales bacterium]|jgi:uncharacterized protein YuzE|nr:hypothetical protein [Chthoniobacterales bacterium]